MKIVNLTVVNIKLITAMRKNSSFWNILTGYYLLVYLRVKSLFCEPCYYFPMRCSFISWLIIFFYFTFKIMKFIINIQKNFLINLNSMILIIKSLIKIYVTNHLFFLIQLYNKNYFLLKCSINQVPFHRPFLFCEVRTSCRFRQFFQFWQ